MHYDNYLNTRCAPPFGCKNVMPRDCLIHEVVCLHISITNLIEFLFFAHEAFYYTTTSSRAVLFEGTAKPRLQRYPLVMCLTFSHFIRRSACPLHIVGSCHALCAPFSALRKLLRLHPLFRIYVICVPPLTLSVLCPPQCLILSVYTSIP